MLHVVAVNDQTLTVLLFQIMTVSHANSLHPTFKPSYSFKRLLLEEKNGCIEYREIFV